MMDWIKGARWRYSLMHIPEGALVYVACLWAGCWPAALAVVVWYWSRKKAEVEAVLWSQGHTHTETTWKGWLPWQWSGWQVLDVVAPGLFYGLLSLWVTA